MTRKCVTEAQHDMATYVEGKVAEEMVSHGEATLQPDGTKRAVIGSIGAALVSTPDGRFRALRPQQSCSLS